MYPWLVRQVPTSGMTNTNLWYDKYQRLVRQIPIGGYKVYQRVIQTWYMYLIDCKRYENYLYSCIGSSPLNAPSAFSASASISSSPG